MEDKNIKISVVVDKLTVDSNRGSIGYVLPYVDMSSLNRHDPIAALRKIPCDINLGTLEMPYSFQVFFLF